MIVNSFQEMCTLKMVVHYAVMVLQPHLIYIDERHVRCMLKRCDRCSEYFILSSMSSKGVSL